MFNKIIDFENNWFSRQSIVRKMHIGSAMVLALTLLMGVTVSLALSQLGNELSHGVETLDATDQAIRMKEATSSGQRHVEEFIRTGNATELEEAEQELAATKTLLADFSEELGEGDQAKTLAELKAAFSEYTEELAELSALYSSQGKAALTSAKGAELIEHLEEEGHALMDPLTGLSLSMIDETREVQTSSAALANNIMTWTILVSVLSQLLGILVAQKIGSALSRPIEAITKAMQALAGGDREVTVPHTDRVDEAGGMARSLEVFRASAIEMEELRAASDESSRLQIERQAEQLMKQQLLIENTRQFEASVSQVVSGVASASSQLQNTALAMSSTANQTSQQTSDVSNALNEASAGITAVAAASDEFAMSVGEISKQAAASAELARIAAASVSQTDETITEMQAAAKQVSQIVNLIQAIAQRTNLLALNASIEAARGGEAGRGFAVVAAEVKDLAMQTSKATDEVAEQIKAIQDTTGASALALRAIAEQVGRLETTSVAIASAVDQQSISGVDLARSIDLAARSTDTVANNIVSVRETALATGTAASQVLTSSNDLESQAGLLREQVESFLSQVRAA